MSSDHSQEAMRFDAPSETERPVGRSIMRGLLNTCPACGSGRLFRAFLKPVDRCAACGEDLSHQRSDDLPPYLVIFIIGHVTVGGYMMTDMIWHLPTWVHMIIWGPITLLTALLTIQPIKGGVIGLQWALRMHGFGGHEDELDDPDAGGYRE